MTALDERTRTEQVTRRELALAHAVLEGLPVDGPLLRTAPVLPAQRRNAVDDAASGLLDVLEGGRDRLARLAALLDAAARQDAVLR